MWYWIFCIVLFGVLMTVDLYTSDDVDFNDVIINAMLAFVPLLNIVMALRVIWELGTTLFVRVVDSVWFSRTWNED